MPICLVWDSKPQSRAPNVDSKTTRPSEPQYVEYYFKKTHFGFCKISWIADVKEANSNLFAISLLILVRLGLLVISYLIPTSLPIGMIKIPFTWSLWAVGHYYLCLFVSMGFLLLLNCWVIFNVLIYSYILVLNFIHFENT